ncbi:MAG: PorT family protein [Cyclobacteriaceae bacterium]|nr:PorT family protein [Cyclobacteriaceae bacterium]
MINKLFIITVILTSNVFISRAQLGVQVGALFVPGEAFLTSPENGMSYSDPLSGTLRYTAGISYGYRITTHLVVRPELNWLHKMWEDWDYGFGDVKMSINYLELPLQLVFTSKGNEGIMIGGGPAILYGIGGKFKDVSSGNEYPYKFNEPDGEKALTLGVNVMLGYRFKRAFFSLNYNRGLTNRDEHPDNFFLNHGNESHVALRVGYMFLK